MAAARCRWEPNTTLDQEGRYGFRGERRDVSVGGSDQSFASRSHAPSEGSIVFVAFALCGFTNFWFCRDLARRFNHHRAHCDAPRSRRDWNRERCSLNCSVSFRFLTLIRMSKTWDPQRILNSPIYAFDFQIMIGDVIDYLDFSETHIERQLRLELQEIHRRDKVEDLPPRYRAHLVENAEFRFGVSLPLRVRYSALISLITSVEWSIRHLVKHLHVSVQQCPKNENETIRSMKSLQTLTGVQRNEDIRTFKDLVRVRNCITHSAGLIKDDKYSEQIVESVQRLDGFLLDTGIS